ncbi:MAG TPA: hypothetical protein VHG93_06805, partial [Longimicrobium sp.]|nr:hypothetical protein [Longimicrobium sp.]
MGYGRFFQYRGSFRNGSIDIPFLQISDQTPLQGVADILARPIVQLEGLGQPLRGRATASATWARCWAAPRRSWARGPAAAGERERAQGAGGIGS